MQLPASALGKAVEDGARAWVPAPTQGSPGVTWLLVATWGVNQQMKALCLCLPLSSSVTLRFKEINVRRWSGRTNREKGGGRGHLDPSAPLLAASAFHSVVSPPAGTWSARSVEGMCSAPAFQRPTLSLLPFSANHPSVFLETCRNFNIVAGFTFVLLFHFLHVLFTLPVTWSRLSPPCPGVTATAAWSHPQARRPQLRGVCNQSDPRDMSLRSVRE